MDNLMPKETWDIMSQHLFVYTQVWRQYRVCFCTISCVKWNVKTVIVGGKTPIVFVSQHNTEQRCLSFGNSGTGCQQRYYYWNLYILFDVSDSVSPEIDPRWEMCLIYNVKINK
jgi:hypothetical protein